MSSRDRALLDALRGVVRPLRGTPDDFAPVLARAADARIVCIGEATHGTHECYRIRAELTKALIRDHGFAAVAVEADWPDAYRVNRYVRGRPGDADAAEALGDFHRFPQWMWRNADVLDFTGWLRAWNDERAPARRVGFYGLDLYSLHASRDAVVRYLRIVDPTAAKRAEARYGCFDHAGHDPQLYGHAVSLGLTPSCEAEVVAQLVELRRRAAEFAARDGRLAPDDLFFAERNAQVVASAEQYYRAMFAGRAASWNLRDRHMAETLEALRTHLEADAPGAKLVVWAHNSHLGDARETEMADHGECNVGQLVRERFGEAACLIGFTTYDGTVTAARDWDGPAERRRVRPALRGSWEALFHALDAGNVCVDWRAPAAAALADEPARLERAIGVLYRPETERWSHYFDARLPRQFDLVLHYDRTRAVEPLERTAQWTAGELPETWPTAL
jgi:erythromycin esterase-like protein